jgi:hypothetical protein
MAQRIQRAGQTHAMELIFFPLIVLILIGLVSNSFSSSAIQTAPVLPTPVCTGNIEPGECYPTNLNGCDANVSANCNFTSSTKFAFLNPNSPFTALFSGNILGFANAFTGASQAGNPTSQPFAFFPNATIVTDQQPNATGGNTFFVGCLNDNGTIWHDFLFNNEKLACWHFFSNATQVPLAYSKLYDGQFPPAPHIANLNCTNFNTANTAFTYQFIGCDNIKNPATAATMVLAFNSTTILNAPNSGNSSKTGVFLYGWAWLPNQNNVRPFTPSNSNSMQVCANIPSAGINYAVAFTPSCNAASTSIHQTICGSAGGSAACSQSTGVGSFLLTVGLIGGIVFLILGLGLQFQIGIFTNTFGMGSNDQGTKMMQALGIGLISWSFLLSEFGGWLFSLPFNLGTIGFLTLTMMFFMGLYWRLFSLD